MPSSTNAVTIEYQGESADAVRAAHEVNKSLDSVEKRAGGIGNAFKGLGGIISGALSVAGGILLTKGLDVAGDFLKGALDEAKQNAEAQAQLTQALANTAAQSGVTAAMVNDLAGEMQLLTKFTDDEILAAGTVLARFKEIGKDIFDDTTKAALDLASVLKIDTVSAAKLLGKALAEPGQGLARLKAAGIVFTDAQEKVIKGLFDTGHAAEAQRMILDHLNATIGGTAEAMGKSAEGQAAIFSHMVDDIKQSVGDILLPVLNGAMSKMIEIFKNPAVQKGIQNFVTGLGNGIARVTEILGRLAQSDFAKTIAGMFSGAGMGGLGEVFAGIQSNAQGFIDWLQTGLGPAITGFVNLPAVQKFGGWFNATVLPALRELAGLIGIGLQKQFALLGTGITGSLTTLGLFATWLDETGIPALEKFAGIINTVVNDAIQTFSDIWLGIVSAFEKVTTFIDSSKKALEELGGLIQGTLQGILEPFAGVIERIRDAFAGVWEFILKTIGALEELGRKAASIDLSNLIPNLPTLSNPFALSPPVNPIPTGGSFGELSARGRNFNNYGSITVTANNVTEMLDSIERELGQRVNVRVRNHE